MSENILNKYEENLKTETEEQKEEIKIVPVSELKANQDHPFKVNRDENLEELMDSIKENGVLNPIIARPHKYGGLEILSGHRRVYACSLLGIKEVPVLIKDIDDDSAIILMVDSNLQREKILPSEKAYAYQLRLEAMKRQGKRFDLTSAQVGQKLEKYSSKEELSEQVGESRNQIQRYIRLTNLIFPILDLVDENKLSLNAAVEISYLGSREQSELMNAIESEEMCPSIEQAKRIRQMSQEGNLYLDGILSVLREVKPEKLKVIISGNKLKKYFPEDYSKKQIEDVIMKLVKKWYLSRQPRER